MDPTALVDPSDLEVSTLGPTNDSRQTSDSSGVPTLTYEGQVYHLFVSTSHSRGSGAFGVVFTADMVGPQGESAAATTEIVAVKIFKGLVPEWSQKLISREVETWKRLKHPRILPFYGMCNLGLQQLGLVSQLAPNGNMNEYIVRNPTKDRLKLLQQVAEGLEYLHRTAQLVHGDLKCSNVLISSDESALLADFGLSTFIGGGDTATATNIRILNSAAFAAPELFSDDAYEGGIINPAQSPRSKTVYSDSFAFGGLIYEAYSGEEPWRGARPHEIIFKVAIKGENPPRVVNNKLALPMSDHLWELCTKCWRREPIERPDCMAILETLTTVRGTESAPTQTRARSTRRNIGRSTGGAGTFRQFLNWFRS